MSNAIKVGDRVWASGLGDGRMLAIHDDYGWVLWNTHDHCTARLDSLTRIEPEPVTLTVGQRVRLCEGRVGVIKDLREEAYVEIDDSREITVHSPPLRIWKLSSELEPVPEPCPECKGSGVASEGGA